MKLLSPLPLGLLGALGTIVALGSLGGCAQNIDDLILCGEDEDCPGGYCHDIDKVCVSGERACSLDTDCNPPTTICQAGQCVEGCTLSDCELGESCNVALGRCRFAESCTIDSQCNPPDQVCVAQVCEPGCPLTGCIDGFCDPHSGHCQGSTACLGDADCDPPSTICEGDLCVSGCTATSCTAGQQCNQVTGRCVQVGGCLGDGDCDPPSTICEGELCVAGCTAASCTTGQQCNQTTGRCEPEGGCVGDGDCDPPSTICEGSACVPGCTATSCATGQQCSQTTGRCEPITTPLADGEDCTGVGSALCQSGYCMEAQIYHNPNWVTFHVCSRACCTENDCDMGFACMYHHGTKMCIPDSIYPPGYLFNLSSGQACGTGTSYCRSGFCNPLTLQCARTCCQDSHCGVDGCVWYDDTASGVMFELCATASGLPPASTGAPCQAPTDCNSWICIGGQCADMCCSNYDCPSGYWCVQVLGQSASPVATTACVPGVVGQAANGSACSTTLTPNDQCQSGLCAGGMCRSPCCSDADCGASLSCRPVPSGFDLNSDGVSELVRACVP